MRSKVELGLGVGLQSMRAGGLTRSETSQAQIQGFELAHSNIYPINELPECTKELVLQIQSLSP